MVAAKEGLQKVSAVFVACFNTFKEAYPEEFVKQEVDGLQRGYLAIINDYFIQLNLT